MLSLPVGVRIVAGLISLVIPRLGDLQYGDWEYMFYSASFAPTGTAPVTVKPENPDNADQIFIILHEWLSLHLLWFNTATGI
jgi:hypothetical protein